MQTPLLTLHLAPLMHPRERAHSREIPRAAGCLCSPCSTSPAAQVVPHNLLLSLFHTHEAEQCVRAVRHRAGQAKVLMDTMVPGCALCHPCDMAESKFTSFSSHCSCHSLKKCFWRFSPVRIMWWSLNIIVHWNIPWNNIIVSWKTLSLLFPLPV